MSTPNPDYPVRVEVDYPDRLSRLLIFVKWLLVIPQMIALLVVEIVAFFAIVAGWFAVLFTGRYPEGLFRFVTGALRWTVRVTAYYSLMTDRYPPFSLEDDPSYPVRVQFDYPAQVARWHVLNCILAVPLVIVLYVIEIIAGVVAFLAWFAILFTGRYPEALFDTFTVYLRWQARVSAYMLSMIEPYPPFVWA
jgi:hypothetical protein